MRNPISWGLVIALWAPLAAGQDAAQTLGADYAKASAAEKIVRLATAQTDKQIEFAKSYELVSEVAAAHVASGKTASARLSLLDTLRGEVRELLKPLNVKRREAKLRVVAFPEPDHTLQQALALEHVAEAAGAQPTVKQLSCLKLVRHATVKHAHGPLVRAFVTGALSRDDDYAKADTVGRLKIVNRIVVELGALDETDRQGPEKTILCEWLSAEFAAGTPVAELKAQLRAWKDAGLVSMFSNTLCAGILDRVEARGRK